MKPVGMTLSHFLLLVACLIREMAMYLLRLVSDRQESSAFS